MSDFHRHYNQHFYIFRKLSYDFYIDIGTEKFYNAYFRSYKQVCKMCYIHRCYTQSYIFVMLSYEFHNDLWQDMGCTEHISEVINNWIKWVTSKGVILKVIFLKSSHISFIMTYDKIWALKHIFLKI